MAYYADTTNDKMLFIPFILSTGNRSFHSTCVDYQRPDHSLYVLIDWSRINAGDFAVVDPCDPHAILYLTDREYKIQLRVSLTNDSRLIVLARPGDVPTSPDSKPVSDRPFSATRDPGDKPADEAAHLLTQLGRLRSYTARMFRTDEDTGLVLLESVDFSKLIPEWGNLLYFWAKGTKNPKAASDFEQMSLVLQHTLEHKGAKGVVLLLKNSYFAIQMFLAGRPLESGWHLDHPVSLSAGLPRWIPRYLRTRVRDRDTELVRVVQSLLFSYKAFYCLGRPSVDTILESPPLITTRDSESFRDSCKLMKDGLVGPRLAYSESLKEFLTPGDPGKFYPLERACGSFKSGPTHTFSLFGANVELLAWFNETRNYLVEFFVSIGHKAALQELQEELASAARVSSIRYIAGQLFYRAEYSPRWLRPVLSKLAFKVEAAAKVRTFAIVDYWTQWALRPLHLFLFDTLKLFSGDATFDQEGVTAEFAKRVHQGQLPVFSFDLKSATDFIPRELYRILFGVWFGEPLAIAWENLISNREFTVPRQFHGLDLSSLPLTVKYGRGQPIGALSSWSALAFVHHILVHHSAILCGYRAWQFRDYVILGDDICIANEAVANIYLVVASQFDIRLSTSKSIPSGIGFFVFANQTWLNNTNLSAISLREETKIRSVSERIEFAIRMVRRGWAFDQNELKLSRLVRLCLTQERYLAASKIWQTGKLDEISPLLLTLFFGPNRSRLQALGLPSLTFSPIAAILIAGIEVFSFGRRIREETLVVDPELRLVVRWAFLGAMMSNITKALNIADRRLSCFSFWASNYFERVPQGVDRSNSFLGLVRVLESRVDRDRLHVREERFELQELRDLLETMPGIPHLFGACTDSYTRGPGFIIIHEPLLESMDPEYAYPGAFEGLLFSLEPSRYLSIPTEIVRYSVHAIHTVFRGGAALGWTSPTFITDRSEWNPSDPYMIKVTSEVYAEYVRLIELVPLEILQGIIDAVPLVPEFDRLWDPNVLRDVPSSREEAMFRYYREQFLLVRWGASLLSDDPVVDYLSRSPSVLLKGPVSNSSSKRRVSTTKPINTVTSRGQDK